MLLHARGAPSRSPAEVLPECWDTARLFGVCATQWRQSPSGALLGLDYAGCRAAAEAMGIDWAGAFAGLVEIEQEALSILATSP